MGPVPAPNSAPAPTSANKESQPSRPAVVLAVDYRLSSPLIDPEDATYVACSKDGLIGQIGKHIQTFDAVDCGAFYASSELVRAIGEAIDTGQPGSLSDGMQRLADQGLAQTCDIGDSWWMDVDDARALELAKAQMREYLPELAADVAGEMTGESGSLGRMGAGREDMRSIAEGEQ